MEKKNIKVISGMLIIGTLFIFALGLINNNALLSLISFILALYLKYKIRVGE